MVRLEKRNDELEACLKKVAKNLGVKPEIDEVIRASKDAGKP